MSKCIYCSAEFSDSVLSFHEKRCPKNPNNNSNEPKESETLRARCDELGIKYIKKTTNKDLKKLISDYETDIMNKAEDLELDSSLPIDELIQRVKEAEKE